MTTGSSINTCEYLLTNKTLLSNPNPNPNPNPTTKQHAIVTIQLIMVTCPAYPEEFIRDNVVVPFVPTLSLSH